MAIAIDATAVGTTISPSSSESGGTITIVHRLTAAEGGGSAWQNCVAKVTGVAGLRPFWKVPLASVASGWDWTGSNATGYFSEDGGLTWTDGITPDYATGGHVILRSQAAFVSDTVWFARQRRECTTQIGNWITNSLAPTGLIANLTGGSSYIADTFSVQTDELSRTQSSGSPLYGFWLRRSAGSGRKVMVALSGMAAGEDYGTTIFRKFIDLIAAQGTTETVALMGMFDFLCLPVICAPGRDMGHYRNSFQVGTGGILDANRHFRDATPALEIVTKPRAVMNTDFTNPAGMLAFQGAYGSSNPTSFGYITDGSSRPPLNTVFCTAWSTRVVASGDSNTSSIPEIDGSSYVTEYGYFDKSAPLSISLEMNQDKHNSDAGITVQATDIIEALYDRVQAGDWGSPPSPPTPAVGGFFLSRRA